MSRTFYYQFGLLICLLISIFSIPLQFKSGWNTFLPPLTGFYRLDYLMAPPRVQNPQPPVGYVPLELGVRLLVSSKNFLTKVYSFFAFNTSYSYMYMYVFRSKFTPQPSFPGWGVNWSYLLKNLRVVTDFWRKILDFSPIFSLFTQGRLLTGVGSSSETGNPVFEGRTRDFPSFSFKLQFTAQPSYPGVVVNWSNLD